MDEILAKAPEVTRRAKNPLALPVIINGRPTQVIPDGLYGIEHLSGQKQGYRFYALECERTSPASRSTSMSSSTKKKKAAYDAVIKTQVFKERWGIPNLEPRIEGRN